MADFSSLGLDESILRAVADAGYTEPTPIQAQAIPSLLEQRDVLGCAQTGTGKTAAFVLPVLHRLLTLIPDRGGRVPRALILAPTRELANQIGESVQTYAKYLPIRHDVIYGGVGINPQLDRLRRGVDLIVATPGRLLEILDMKVISLREVEFLVLDEADRMLDMGFIRDIRRVMTFLPSVRQNLLFSATMPKEIQELADTFLRRPVKIEVAPPATTVERITQYLQWVEKGDKPEALARLVRRLSIERGIVFTRTKHGANRVVNVLEKEGIGALAIHGNKSQSARERALSAFRDGAIPLLIATDIASRGIDVDGVTHVINFDLPDEPDVYVHRIGRTGRAGRVGISVSFCATEERALLYDIVRLTNHPIDIIDGAGDVVGAYEVPTKNTRRPPAPKREVRGGGGGGRQDHGRGRGPEPKPRHFDGERAPRPAHAPRAEAREPEARRLGIGEEGGAPRNPGAERPRRDGGPRQDGGPRRDGGPRQDGGPRRDGGPRQDGGPRRDGGPRQDGGPRGAVNPRGGRAQESQGAGRPAASNERDASRSRAPRPPQDYSAAAKPPSANAALPSDAGASRMRRPRR